MQTTITRFNLTNDRDVKLAAQRARLLGTLAGLPDRERTAFGRAVREIAQNVTQHATNGMIEYRVDTYEQSSVIEAAIHDQTPFSDDFAALIASESLEAGGLRQARAAASYLVASPKPNGKVIRVLMTLPEHVAVFNETDVAEWASILRTRRTQSAVAFSQRRNRDLADQLSNIQKQRQELESELHRTRSVNETLTLLSLVASKTDNAVVIMDEHGLISWVNDAFIGMTGYGLPDSTGTRPDILLTGPNTSREAVREIEQAFRMGHGVTEEVLQYRRDGSSSWISLSLTPIHDENGRVSRWIGIGSDITRRRESQNALEAARDAAETASRLKGEFLANMSHEIRTPMNAIIGMTDLTLCSQLDGEQREYLSTVKQSAESLLELLNDILDLSKIESGRLDIQETPFHLQSVLAETLKPFTIISKQQGLNLKWSLPDDVPEWLVGDPVRLRQVLVNLVGNAIKFTFEGSIEIFVELQGTSLDEIGLHFTVADTGIGIAPNKLEHIFDSFTQADPSITRQFGGTGLGLAISSELLRLMNGRVWVQSELGKGSRFHFSLRLRLATEAEIATNLVEDASSISDNQPLERSQALLNVLVADDHPANQKLIEKILEKCGHSIHFASNGREVVDAVVEQNFDIILMDLQMPKMDGYQATAAIREYELETRTHIPIIAVTAHTMQGDRESCLAAGMDAYLSKPIRARELVTLVESLGNNQINTSATSATAIGFVALDANPAEERIVMECETTPPRTAQPSLLRDFSAALERLDNDEELLRDQMQYFLTDGPVLLEMMKTALHEKNGTQLQIAAHRLKNLSATFDDEGTARLCGELEFMGRDTQFNSAVQCIVEVKHAVESLIKAIQTYV